MKQISNFFDRNIREREVSCYIQYLWSYLSYSVLFTLYNVLRSPFLQPQHAFLTLRRRHCGIRVHGCCPPPAANTSGSLWLRAIRLFHREIREDGR